MGRRIYVLDTSALIGGFSPGRGGGEQVTVPSVLEELKEGISRSRLEAGILERKVRVLESPREELREVERLAARTGNRLSRTDRELLALALSLKKGEEEVEVVTDDYGLQNLASVMGIPHRGLLMPGIRRVLRWIKVCPACGRKYPVRNRSCSACGSELKKVGEDVEG